MSGPDNVTAPPLWSGCMGRVALTVGLAILALTAASQFGLLGSHDFSVIAATGLVAAVFCLVTTLAARSRQALVGAVMSAVPVALLVYYLSTSDG